MEGEFVSSPAKLHSIWVIYSAGGLSVLNSFYEAHLSESFYGRITGIYSRCVNESCVFFFLQKSSIEYLY